MAPNSYCLNLNFQRTPKHKNLTHSKPGAKNIFINWQNIMATSIFDSLQLKINLNFKKVNFEYTHHIYSLKKHGITRNIKILLD